MSPQVVVIDHHDSYTYNLVHLLAAVTGQLPEVVQHDETTAETVLDGRFSHIVLSPGPGTPDDARDFSVGRSVITQATVPVLGVCLGLQGMVATYGGRVAPILPAHGELASIQHDAAGVFAGLPQDFLAVRYHSLACVELPEVLVETAWCGSGRERVVMAAAHRDKPQLGVQFHPEAILTEHGAAMVANFLALQ